MWKGILLDPREAPTCPLCGQPEKPIGSELCGECLNRCPDPEHFKKGKVVRKTPRREVCGLCYYRMLNRNQNRDKRKGRNEFWVYAVQLDDGSAYYGHTYNPDSRYIAHLNNRVRQTMNRNPVAVFKFGPWPTRAQAYRAERAVTLAQLRNSFWWCSPEEGSEFVEFKKFEPAKLDSLNTLALTAHFPVA